MEDQLFITNRFGEKLEAILRKPDNGDVFPAVLFVSGFGMDLHEWKNSNDEISKELVKKGILTLQFSFSGCGKSEGDYREMTLERQAKQVEDMIACLRKRTDVNKTSIGIHATSMGVPTTLLANLEGIKTLCFVSGAYRVNESIHRVYEEERGVTINYEGETLMPRGSGTFTPVGLGFWKSIASFDVARLIPKITSPVFVVHGNQDTKITTEEVKEVYNILPNKKKQLKVYIGGDHGITDVPKFLRNEFLKDVVDWHVAT